MAKDKEKRALNPAAAALKAQKAASAKKGKAQVAAQRNERLARRNPDRLERQIDDLKAAEERGQLRPKDKQTLEQLQRDLKAVRRARESLGEKAPQFARWRDDDDDRRQGQSGRGRDGNVLGKRRRDGGGWKRNDEPSSSETDEDIRDIPMPKDVENEPPIPRRPRKPQPQNANETPLGEARMPHVLPPKPVSQTVYSSAPQVRNLQKEAVSRFVPAAVAAKKKLAQGQGRLLEPEEADKLAKEGYMGGRRTSQAKEGDTDMADDELERFQKEIEGLGEGAYQDSGKAADEAEKEVQHMVINDVVQGEPSDAAMTKRLRQVEIEEVEDDG
ncbi:hypothetical protein NA57DRAFT_57195 [Rhizodiscina lignyota]|uniref:Wbp11/ELF5/Saf1 N-terminal domain-containing protein n=1 Tax=Rhizodiscina lignyota TaxID=1504668 RepID=A0A9P4IGZ0_9PEZI|nr:hypothetical protein NA57DRAFT_57195 [Rhizodiscina lignyota]